MKQYITHYAFHTLVANNRNFFTEFLSDVNTFGKLCNRIDKFAEEQHDNYGYSAGIHYKTPEEAINKFKGDLFEIFIEIFIKTNCFGNVLDITNYQNTKKDYPGVDAIGTVQTKKVAVQIKFLSNPKNHVNTDDMMGFYAVSTGDLGITPNTKNMILITSSEEGIDYVRMNAIFRDILKNNIRIINHGIISGFIDTNHDVWNRVNEFIENSILNLDEIKSSVKLNDNKDSIVSERIKSLKDLPSQDSPFKKYLKPAHHTNKKDNNGNYILMPEREIYNYSQLECYNKMQESDKLTVILPTGTGKGYLLFVDLLSRIHNKKGKVFAICSHRIVLNKQHTMDMFEDFKDFIGDIGYIFVASENINIGDKKDSLEYTTLLSEVNKRNGINTTDINDVISTLKPDQNLQEVIDYHARKGRSVVIISTYHSLQKLHGVNIDTIYCDEADKLVTDKTLRTKDGVKEESFMQKFLKITAKNKYFLTATPKDWSKDWTGESINFMNNVAIFGERIEMEFYAAVKSAYIVQPYIHIVYPMQYDIEDIEGEDEEDLENINGVEDVSSVKNMNVNVKAKIAMIVESFKAHRLFLAERSAYPDKIKPKMLVKCKNISHEMWGIFHEGLREALPEVKMFAGGSYGYSEDSTDNEDYINNNHYMYDPSSGLKVIKNRDSYLQEIMKLELDEEAIVLHCDILSEGINVKGFTNVNFVSGITSTDAKAMQNIGRATRVIDLDRKRLDTGEISTDDMSTWYKPFCSVTIPFWNAESAEAKDKMLNLILHLRNQGFEIERFGTGSEMNKDDKKEEDAETQNEPKQSKRKSGIKELEQQLEELEYLNQLNSLSPIDYVYEMGN